MRDSSLKSERLLEFHNAGRTDLGVGFILAGIILGVTARFAPDVSNAVQTVSWFGGGALVLAGLVVLGWRQSIRFDAEGFAYERIRGVFPFRRRIRGYVSDLDRIVLQPRTFRTYDGLQSTLYLALAVGSRESFSLFQSSDAEAARERVERLAARLGIAFAEAPAETIRPSRGPVRVALVSGAVCSVAALTAVVLWPVVSGGYFRDRARLSAEQQRAGQTRFSPFGLPDVRRRDADRYLFSGQFEEAEKAYRELLERNPNDAGILNQLAYAIARKGQGDIELALEVAKKAVSQAPQEGYIVDTLAEMNELRGNYEEAARQYERALSLSFAQDSAETHAKFGRTLLALGRHQAAYEQLLKALERDIGSEWNDLARKLLRETKWPENIEKHSSLRPQEPKRSIPRFIPAPGAGAGFSPPGVTF